nr:Rpn family recombination-promoting nuclease/putative transposase [uncultured Romboutsia sp.]
MSFGILSPKVDFVFKKIFGNEKHPNILISFLNAVIKPTDLIKSVQIKNTDIEKEHIEDKYSRLDIKAITNNGEQINIEIQVKNEYNMIKRSLYYWSKMYEGQLTKGQDYDTLSRTICINILDFKYLKNDNFHNCYRLKEKNTNEELTDVMELHFIEIPKLRKLENSEDISDMLEAWITFIESPTSELIDKLEMSSDEIKEAKEELLRLSGNDKERERYEKRFESLLEQNSLLANAERKGLQKGIEKGKKEGESRKTIEIAINLIKNGLDNELIKNTTGLSIKEIKELRNKK